MWLPIWMDLKTVTDHNFKPAIKSPLCPGFDCDWFKERGPMPEGGRGGASLSAADPWAALGGARVRVSTTEDVTVPLLKLAAAPPEAELAHSGASGQGPSFWALGLRRALLFSVLMWLVSDGSGTWGLCGMLGLWSSKPPSCTTGPLTFSRPSSRPFRGLQSWQGFSLEMLHRSSCSEGAWGLWRTGAPWGPTRGLQGLEKGLGERVLWVGLWELSSLASTQGLTSACWLCLESRFEGDICLADKCLMTLHWSAMTPRSHCTTKTQQLEWHYKLDTSTQYKIKQTDNESKQ